MLQLSLDYISAEDRLLLRIGLGEEEARFWITRSIVKDLWRMLGRAAQRLVPASLPPEMRHEASEMQRQAAVQALDFNRPYLAERKAVLSALPLLPTRIDIDQPPGQAAPTFRLHAPDGRFVALPLDPGLHAGLTELLKKAVAQADWDMQLSVKPAAGPVPAGIH